MTRSTRSLLCRGVLALGALALPAVIPAHAQDALPRLLRPADVDALPVRTAGERLAYGTDSLQFGDLRLPDGPGPFPVAIVIHGGCWFSPYATIRNAAPLADALRDAGIATWNIEYRRYDHPGGGWPGTFLDVGQAADHVRQLATTYPLDSTRVVAIGHSAGAQLGAWLATRGRTTAASALYAAHPLALSGVVSLGGVMDMREFQGRQGQTCGNPAIESVLGGLPHEVPERYREVSPIERLPLGVPHVHVAGALDRIAPRAVVETFAERAQAAGDSVRMITVPALGHHDVMSPGTAGGQAAIEAVRQLVGFGGRR
jgi:acetyl esterase/lipase